MNKGKKSQGIIKIPNHESQFIQQHQNHSASDNKHVFKADSHDFPSLSEAFEGNKKQEKKSLKYGTSDFTYSGKLKIQPQEKVMQHIPLENLCQNKSVCFKSKASINSRANNSACTLKSSQATQSIPLGSKRQSLPADNKLPSSSKNLSHSLRYSGISKEKNGKSDLVSQNSDLFGKQKNHCNYTNNPNICLNENNPLTEKRISSQKKSNTAQEKPSASLKKEQSFNKIHKDNFVSRSSVQNSIVSNGSDINNWRSNTNHVSSTKSEMSCNKADEWVIIENKSKHSELNKFGNSAPISNKNISQSHQNITQPSTRGSNVNTIKTQKASLNPKLPNSSENNVKSQTSSTQQASGETGKVKKKRKRDSKLKRQAALQSGKLLVLTPEVHSKIIKQSNNVNIQKHKNVVVNINDSEEYPELGSSESKNNKEVSVKVPGICSKTEIPVSPITDGFESNKFDAESTISKEVSETNNVHEAAKLDAKGSAKNVEEVKVVRSSNPITLSLFDMLLTAKPKMKKSERKDESQVKFGKVIKKETIRKAVNNAVLNSSRPIVKRGKEREIPKIKRPSRLRKLILLGRQQKRESMITRNHGSENSVSDECSLSPEKSVEMDESKSENRISEVDSSCAINKNENEEILSKDLNNCKKDLVFCRKEESENSVQNFTACDEENQKKFQTGPTKHGMNVFKLSTESQAVLKGFENSDIENKFLESNLCLINSHEVEELSTVRKTCNESDYKCSEEFLRHHSTPDVPFAEREVTNHLSECPFNSKLIDWENHVDNGHSANDIDCIEYRDDDCANDIQHNKTLISNVIETFTDTDWVHEKQDSPLNSLKEALDITSEAATEKKSTNDICAADHNLIKNKIEAVSITENTGCTYNLISDVVTSGDQMINDTSNKSLASNIFTIDCNLDDGKKMEDKSDTMKMDSHGENISHVSENLYSDQERLQAIKLLLHSRKFRQYCNHFISRQIDETVFALIDDLARFQDRMHQKDPVKAKRKRRLVYGIKEIKKHMQLKKIKCIVIATDIEDIKIEGGLNDIIEELKSLAEVYHIPYIFSHRRFNLGKICRKSVPVSCVGVFNYEGSEKNFKKLVEFYEDSKYDYSLLTKKLASELTGDQIKELFEAEKEPLLLHEASQRILREMLYSSPEGFKISSVSNSIKNGESCSINANLMPYTQLADNNFTDVETTISFSSKKCSNPEENFDALLNEKTNIILKKYNVVKE